MGQSNDSLSPLVHTTKSGALLRRAPDIEMQIHNALALPIDELLERAKLKDSQNPDFFEAEVLIYLIRAFHKSGDRDVTSQLSEALLNRCAKFIYSKLNGLDPDDADDAYRDVVAKLFEQILFREDGRGDYFEVRFGSALQRLTISVFRSHIAVVEEDRENRVAISDLAGEEIEEVDDDEITTGFIPHTAITKKEISIEDNLRLKEAIDVLKEPLRTAYILRNMYDFQVESGDPDEPTLSKIFDKDPRTIRYWLKHADAILEEWLGEDHE